MVGYGNNKGILPVTCDELFKEIDRNKGSSQCRYQVGSPVALLLSLTASGDVFHAGDLQ